MEVKNFSVGDGDMFYINHDSDNFTVIDCCLDYDEDSRSAKLHVLEEIERIAAQKGMTRFISTHPDEDHISGLRELNRHFSLQNFYCVKNKASKEDESDSFRFYKEKRDSADSFYLYNGVQRRWLNQSNAERDSSNLECLWPVTTNEQYQTALENVRHGSDFNNISPAIRLEEGGASFLWMGDMETAMQREFAGCVNVPSTTVVFAPHHGRASGSIPRELLDMLQPKLIVVGEAPSEHLNYYSGYNTITQNTAGDIRFEVHSSIVDVYVSNLAYNKRPANMYLRTIYTNQDWKYLGSLRA